MRVKNKNGRQRIQLLASIETETRITSWTSRVEFIISRERNLEACASHRRIGYKKEIEEDLETREDDFYQHFCCQLFETFENYGGRDFGHRGTPGRLFRFAEVTIKWNPSGRPQPL